MLLDPGPREVAFPAHMKESCANALLTMCRQQPSRRTQRCVPFVQEVHLMLLNLVPMQQEYFGLLRSAWGKKHEQLTLTSIKSVWAGLSDFILRNLLIGKVPRGAPNAPLPSPSHPFRYDARTLNPGAPLAACHFLLPLTHDSLKQVQQTSASARPKATPSRVFAPQNVAVPYLGVFLVCKAIDTGTGNKLSLVRPFFELLAGRFSSVPHHIGRHSPSARGAACQPSYVAISKASGVHRVLCAQV